MIVIKVDDLREQYLHLALDVYSEGRTIAPRGKVTKELDNVALVFRSPEHATFPVEVGRKVSPAILSAELMHIIAGVSDLKQLDSASKGVFSEFSDDGRVLSGAYGPRAYMGLDRCVWALMSDQSTRQATVSLWDRYEKDSKDLPCTLSWSFTIRDGTLRMVTMMRSNDVIKGLAYDVPFMARLQSAMAWALRVPAGTYTHFAQSLHVYSTDVETITGMTGTVYPPTSSTEQPPLFHSLPHLEGTALERWDEVRKAAMLAMRHDRGDVELPPEFEWYARKLDAHPGYDFFCRECRYFIPDENHHD
jgi:thymidylate synthase